MAGGLYDQHPKFIDDMLIIMSVKSEHDKREAAKKEAELGARQRAGGGKSRKMPRRGRRG